MSTLHSLADQTASYMLPITLLETEREEANIEKKQRRQAVDHHMEKYHGHSPCWDGTTEACARGLMATTISRVHRSRQTPLLLCSVIDATAPSTWTV